MRINGINELAITKLDVLSGLDQLFICSRYKKHGNEFKELPFGPGELIGYEPINEEVPGWQEDITAICRWTDLPENARTYIQYIEEIIGIKIRLVSVGPERDQVIDRNSTELSTT